MGFHYDTANIAFKDGWGAFLQGWLDRNVEGGSWFDHFSLGYSRSKMTDSDVLLVRYEDLKTNADKTIHPISKFVKKGNNTPMNNELMAQVKDLTSFE